MLNLFVGDGAVAYQHVENQNPVWGYTIIGLMFLPNVVFILWFVLGNKRQVGQSRRRTLTKILVAGSVQLVTLIKYVKRTNTT